MCSGKREGITLLAIEGIELDRRRAFKLAADAVSDHDWAQIALALRMESVLFEPERSCVYFQQLDQVRLHKEAVAIEALSPTAFSPTGPPKGAGAVNPAIARLQGGGGGGGGGDANESFMSTSELEQNPLSMSATMAATDPLGAVTGTPVSQCKKVAVTSTPLGGEAVSLASTPLGLPEAIPVEPATAQASNAGRGRRMSALEACKLSERSFQLKHLPTPDMLMELQNVAVELDDLALLLKLMEDCCPDDLLPQSQ